jgi:hypothetical protein
MFPSLDDDCAIGTAVHHLAPKCEDDSLKRDKQGDNQAQKRSVASLQPCDVDSLDIGCTKLILFNHKGSQILYNLLLDLNVVQSP